MKKVLITLTAVLTLMSCSKEEMTETQEASFSIADDYRLVSVDYLKRRSAIYSQRLYVGTLGHSLVKVNTLETNTIKKLVSIDIKYQILIQQHLK